MKNEVEIKKIVKQEQKVSNTKTYLIILFFIVSIVVIISFFVIIRSQAVSEVRGAQILTMAIVYKVLLIAGYFYNRALSVKMKKLWNQRQSLL